MYLKWVRDRFPVSAESGKPLIVTTKNGGVTCAIYDFSSKSWTLAWSGLKLQAADVIAWMELPEPYVKHDKTARAIAAKAREQRIKKARIKRGGERFRAFVDTAKRNGITMSSIAEATGVSKAYISQLYACGKRCSPELASSIVHAYPWAGPYDALMGYCKADEDGTDAD